MTASPSIMGSTIFAGGLRSWTCLCCLVPARKTWGNEPASPCSEHTCSMLLQPPACPLPEVGTTPWSSTILDNLHYGARSSSPLWHISRSPHEPRNVQSSTVELQPTPPKHRARCQPSAGPALSTDPGPGPYRRTWPEPQQPRGSGVGTARKSAGTWPEAWAYIRQRLRLPFHSQWLLHQTHWWAEISAGF